MAARSHNPRSCSSSGIRSPVAVALARRRESCSSSSASRPLHLGLGQQPGQQPREADGFRRQVRPQQVVALRGRIALVEDQIDHPQHIGQPLRQRVRLGHLIGDAGIADFRLCPDDPLGQGGRRDQAGVGDGLGRQPADLAQGEGDAGFLRKARVAAGEDQPQPVVLDRLRVRRAPAIRRRARRSARPPRSTASSGAGGAAGRSPGNARPRPARQPGFAASPRAASVRPLPRRRSAAPPRPDRSCPAAGPASRRRGARRDDRHPGSDRSRCLARS